MPLTEDKKKVEYNGHWSLFISNKNGNVDYEEFSTLIWAIKGSSKFRATAENINPDNGNLTSKENKIISKPKDDGEVAFFKHVGPAGYVRWNIQFLD